MTWLFDVGAGNRLALRAQRVNMKLDGLTDQLQDLTTRLTRRDATREIGNISTVAGLALFHYNQIFHRSVPTVV
jgi:hypothetical protein